MTAGGNDANHECDDREPDRRTTTGNSATVAAPRLARAELTHCRQRQRSERAAKAGNWPGNKLIFLGQSLVRTGAASVRTHKQRCSITVATELACYRNLPCIELNQPESTLAFYEHYMPQRPAPPTRVLHTALWPQLCPARLCRHGAGRSALAGGNLTPASRVLELGCGNGGIAAYIASTGAHVTGLTMRSSHLLKHRPGNASRPAHFPGGGQLPFPPAMMQSPSQRISELRALRLTLRHGCIWLTQPIPSRLPVEESALSTDSGPMQVRFTWILRHPDAQDRGGRLGACARHSL